MIQYIDGQTGNVPGFQFRNLVKGWRASAHADVKTSTCNGESIFEKPHLLKWTLIMSESAPLKDNAHNFQNGHNGKHLIWWSLMRPHQQHLMAPAIHSDLSGLNEKPKNPLSGRHLCRNKTAYAHRFKKSVWRRVQTERSVCKFQNSSN